MPPSRTGKCALVTVGTTKFDRLIQGIDALELLHALKARGFSKLTVQHGRGEYNVQHIFPSPVEGLHVECGSTALCWWKCTLLYVGALQLIAFPFGAGMCLGCRSTAAER